MLKIRIILAASTLALLSLTGCASQAQIQAQNGQLDAVNARLIQIELNQKVQNQEAAETNRWLKRMYEQPK